MVSKGQLLAKIETPEGTIVDVPASMDGLLRGLIRDGYPVTKDLRSQISIRELKNTITALQFQIKPDALQVVFWKHYYI